MPYPYKGKMKMSEKLKQTNSTNGLNAANNRPASLCSQFIIASIAAIVVTSASASTQRPDITTAATNNKKTTTTTLSVTPNPAPQFAAITAQAQVSGGNPTGTVTFTLENISGSNTSGVVCNSVPLINNMATCTNIGPFTAKPGNYPIIAKYNGDVNHNPSTTTVPLVRDLWQSKLTFGYAPDWSITGQNNTGSIIFSGTTTTPVSLVSQTPSICTVKLDSTPITGSGLAPHYKYFITPLLVGGKCVLQADLAGDSMYYPASTVTLSRQVIK
jgi:hypothetical protein